MKMPKLILWVAVLMLVISTSCFAGSVDKMAKKANLIDELAHGDWTVHDVRSGPVVLTQTNRRTALNSGRFHGEEWREIILVSDRGRVLRVFALPWHTHYDAYASLRTGFRVRFQSTQGGREAYSSTHNIALSIAPSYIRGRRVLVR
jgi:hypothetical protein